MVGRAIAAAALTAALLGSGLGGARAQAPERLRVAVDWSRVRDPDVERCGLSRLRAGTIERLVDEGHAVVDAIDPDGVRVAVASSSAGLHIHVESAGVAREEALHAGEACDATFVLHVISRIAELVEEVARARPPASEAAPVESAAEPAAERAAPAAPRAGFRAPRAGLQASIDVTTRVNESPGFLLGGGLGVRARLLAGWESGVRAELVAGGGLDVTVMEAFFGVAAAHQPSLPGVGPYVELGPVLHLASSDARSVTELDAALGAGVQASVSHFLAQLLLYARLRSFEHRVGPEIAFDSGHFGIILRIGAQLSGS